VQVLPAPLGRAVSNDIRQSTPDKRRIYSHGERGQEHLLHPLAGAGINAD
jgi:hypothetical protein